jgi:peptidoglycan lytic transglycosylase G
VSTRKSERGTRNRRATSDAVFRVPTSPFRVLLALSLAACGSADGPRVTVTIPPGATLDAAVDSLAANHVIDHPGTFRLYAKLSGLTRSLKSGVYLLHQDQSWSDVVAALERGRGVEQRFTVREGLRLAEVADLARAQLRIPRDSFLAAAEDSSLLVSLGLPAEAPSAEGYLYPTTYLLPLRIGARELVRVMAHQFTQQWSPEWQARLDSLHFSRHELVTLASIVEAEVRYDPDRPFVSAVYHNRLKRGMRLEADPTVSYAYGRRLRRVWEKNLAVRSPYNTYLHTGLPPGPIGQPGRAGLVAALYPADVPFLYFVAQPDGKHIFSVTYAEHLVAIQRVKQLRRAGRAPQRPGRESPTQRR